MLQMTPVMAASFARREPQDPTFGPETPARGAHGGMTLRPVRRRRPLRPVDRGKAYVLVHPPLLVDRPHQPAERHTGQRGSITSVPRHRGREGQVIGGTFNETMPSLDVAPEFRRDDPFLAAVFAILEPI